MDALESLRRIRRDKGITLKALGELTELSANYLSQIERGQANPSIATLKRITDALGVSFMSLVENGNGGPPPEPEPGGKAAEPARVVRADQRKKLIYPGGRRRALLLSPDLQGKLEVIITVEDPVPEEGGEWYSHEGEEFGLVLEGCYEVEVGDKVYRLNEEDSITYSSHQPHRMRNPGDKPSKTLWVITPPSF